VDFYLLISLHLLNYLLKWGKCKKVQNANSINSGRLFGGVMVIPKVNDGLTKDAAVTRQEERGLRVNRPGKPLRIEDHRVFNIFALNADPLSCVREAVQNALEANATTVDIFPSRRDTVVVRDDGIGMTRAQLVRFMGAYGASGKTIAADKNLGIGLKAVGAVQNPNSGVLITSWRDPNIAHQVCIAKINDTEYGLVEFGNGDVVREVRLPSGVKSRTGTQVEFTETAFVPVQILRFLNGRYLKFTSIVRVQHQGGGNGVQWRNAMGLLASMEKICAATGQLSLPNCNLYWGIRREARDASDERTLQLLREREFAADPLYFAAWGEAYQSWAAGSGGYQKLYGWGIRAANRDIILVIEHKGRKLGPTPDRSGVSGYDENAEQEQVAENMPEPLQTHMVDFELRNFDKKAESELVREMLRLIDISSFLRIETDSDSESDGDTESTPRSRGTSSNGGVKKPRKDLGIPEHEWVGEDQLGSDPVHFDSAHSRFLVNRDYPSVKKALAGCRNERERMQVKALIVVPLIGVTAAWISQRGELPRQETLESLVMFPPMVGARSIFTGTMRRAKKKD